MLQANQSSNSGKQATSADLAERLLDLNNCFGSAEMLHAPAICP